MRVWISKYALTQGIYQIEGERCETHKGVLDNFSSNDRFKQFFHGEGKEWHRTHVEAVKRANEMRVKKLQSLRRQFNILEAKVFE